LGVILRQSFATVVEGGEIQLGGCVARLGGAAEPGCRLCGVLLDAIASGIHQREVGRRIPRSELRRFGVPGNSLGFVGRHSEARLTEDSHGFLRRDKTTIGGVLQQAKRLGIVHLQ
jgi:hypothetical protein